jgi:hypothetical protein
MESVPRHQCLIYAGSPSQHLPALAAIIQEKLKANYRCFYMNSPAMVAGIRSYLSAGGLDVAHEIAKASLVLSSDREHLVDGRFDPERMLHLLKDNVVQALNEGYEGLWASGDMSWEFGPDQYFGKLLEYELGLEKLFKSHPALCGVCQYHSDTLPPEAVSHGLVLHRRPFVNEILSRINRDYFPPDA